MLRRLGKAMAELAERVEGTSQSPSPREATSSSWLRSRTGFSTCCSRRATSYSLTRINMPIDKRIVILGSGGEPQAPNLLPPPPLRLELTLPSRPTPRSRRPLVRARSRAEGLPHPHHRARPARGLDLAGLCLALGCASPLLLRSTSSSYSLDSVADSSDRVHAGCQLDAVLLAGRGPSPSQVGGGHLRPLGLARSLGPRHVAERHTPLRRHRGRPTRPLVPRHGPQLPRARPERPAQRRRGRRRVRHALDQRAPVLPGARTRAADARCDVRAQVGHVDRAGVRGPGHRARHQRYRARSVLIARSTVLLSSPAADPVSPCSQAPSRSPASRTRRATLCEARRCSSSPTASAARWTRPVRPTHPPCPSVSVSCVALTDTVLVQIPRRPLTSFHDPAARSSAAAPTWCVPLFLQLDTSLIHALTSHPHGPRADRELGPLALAFDRAAHPRPVPRARPVHLVRRHPRRHPRPAAQRRPAPCAHGRPARRGRQARAAARALDRGGLGARARDGALCCRQQCVGEA